MTWLPRIGCPSVYNYNVLKHKAEKEANDHHSKTFERILIKKEKKKSTSCTTRMLKKIIYIYIYIYIYERERALHKL